MRSVEESISTCSFIVFFLAWNQRHFGSFSLCMSVCTPFIGEVIYLSSTRNRLSGNILDGSYGWILGSTWGPHEETKNQCPGLPAQRNHHSGVKITEDPDTQEIPCSELSNTSNDPCLYIHEPIQVATSWSEGEPERRYTTETRSHYCYLGYHALESCLYYALSCASNCYCHQT